MAETAEINGLKILEVYHTVIITQNNMSMICYREKDLLFCTVYLILKGIFLEF